MLRSFVSFFLIGPLVELAVALIVAHYIGGLNTVLLIIGTSVLGMVLIRGEGIAALRGIQGDLRRGIPPSVGLMNGALRVLGAVLLIIPGLVTATIGLLLLIPPVRMLVVPLAIARLAARAAAATGGLGVGTIVVDTDGRGGTRGWGRDASTDGGDVVDVEGWEVDGRLPLPPVDDDADGGGADGGGGGRP